MVISEWCEDLLRFDYSAALNAVAEATRNQSYFPSWAQLWPYLRKHQDPINLAREQAEGMQRPALSDSYELTDKERAQVRKTFSDLSKRMGWDRPDKQEANDD